MIRDAQWVEIDLLMFEGEHVVENRIAQLTLDNHPLQWSDGTEVFVEVADVAAILGTVVAEIGTRQSPPPTPDLYAAWRELRKVMATPEKGAGFSARLLIASSGRYRFEFDWDKRPAWPSSVGVDGALTGSSEVPDSLLLAERIKFPRAKDSEPKWLRDVVAASARVVVAEPDRDATWARLVDDSNWRIVDEALAEEIHALVIDHELADVDPSYLAQDVFSQFVGSTDGSQLRNLSRIAMAIGVMDDIPLSSDDWDEPSWELVERSSDFQQMLDGLLPVFVSLAMERVDAATGSSRHLADGIMTVEAPADPALRLDRPATP